MKRTQSCPNFRYLLRGNKENKGNPPNLESPSQERSFSQVFPNTKYDCYTLYHDILYIVGKVIYLSLFICIYFIYILYLLVSVAQTRPIQCRMVE
jgi:hypothetical protein